MRPPVAIALLICGTCLASAPIVSDFLQASVISRALAEPSAFGASHFFRQPLEESYRLGCWILGGAIISFGILGTYGPRTMFGHERDPEAAQVIRRHPNDARGFESWNPS